MAVKRCPSCGDLYLAAVERCADCDVVLVEVAERPADDAAVPSSPSGDQDQWELESWTMEGRRLLDGMLNTADIPRAWHGTTLSTPQSARELVDQMVSVVAQGDARVGVDDEQLAANDAEVTSSADLGETVAYEVSDWEPAALNRLAERLVHGGIPFGWDADGDLVVPQAEEAAVDAVFAALDDGGDDAIDDGPGAHQAMSDLFLAADTLARNPLDGPAGRAAVAGAERLATYRLPFGFSPAVWEALNEQATALAAELGSGGLDDDAVEERATALRATLRDVV